MTRQFVAACVSLSAWAVAVTVIGPGCAEVDGGAPSLAEQAKQHGEARTEGAKPAPKSTQELEKMGVPIVKGTVIDEGPDSSTVTERAFRRTYYAKLYSPGNVDAVARFYGSGLGSSTVSGSKTGTLVRGKVKDGSDVEVRIGPSSEKDRSLVMVWLSEPK